MLIVSVVMAMMMMHVVRSCVFCGNADNDDV